MNDGLLRTVEGTVVAAEPAHRDSTLEDDGDEHSALHGPSEWSQTFDMQVSRAESISDTSDQLLPLPASSAQRIRVTVLWRNNTPATLHCGDQIQVVTQLHSPAEYHDPGVWDLEAYLATQSVSASGSVPAYLPDRLQRMDFAGEHSATCLLNQWRERVASRIEQLPASMRFCPHC